MSPFRLAWYMRKYLWVDGGEGWCGWERWGGSGTLEYLQGLEVGLAMPGLKRSWQVHQA